MFDPFGDFEAAGYLRNVLALKDPGEIAAAQHNFFLAGLDEAVRFLSRRKILTYLDFCEVHRLLFGGFYPWAGQDRQSLGVGEFISKGQRVQFERSSMAQAAIELGLRMGNNPKAIAERPGHVMGLFAWGHPFLDGNGRTMTVVHAELLHRAGFVIDWTRTRKNEYLEVLTHELDEPRPGHLDAYLQPLLVPSNPRIPWVDQLRTMPGLDGHGSDPSDTVAYAADDARGIAEYEALVRMRNGMRE